MTSDQRVPDGWASGPDPTAAPDPIPTPDPIGEAGGGASTPDVDRRGFFGAFSKEAIQTLASVAAMAASLQRGSAAAAEELLGLGIRSPTDTAGRLGTAPAFGGSPLAGAPGEPPRTTSGVAYRSPYRLRGDALVLIDQRRLPDEAIEIVCPGGAEIAAAMRELRVRGAPALAQVAAYGLWLMAQRARDQLSYARAAMIRGTADAFRFARPSVAPMRAAIERVLAAWYAVGEYHDDGAVVADAIRGVADAIASEALMGLARLGRNGAGRAPRPADRPLRIITLDETGPLSGGMVGTAMTVVQTLVTEGVAVEVFVAETRPTLTGGRLAIWELQQADIPATLVADSSVGWLVTSGAIDLVLVGADAIAADGALLNAAGTYAMALAAARAGVPVYACTPIAALDPRAATGAELKPELRRLVAGSLAELDTLQAGAGDVAVVELPLQDVTPPDLISAYVTDEGIAEAPFATSLAAQAAAAEERRGGTLGASG